MIALSQIHPVFTTNLVLDVILGQLSIKCVGRSKYTIYHKARFGGSPCLNINFLIGVLNHKIKLRHTL